MDSSHTPARPRSHRIGDVGQTTVALLFKRWGWTADLISSDYGEDLDCTVFLERQRTALHFRCQVKAHEGDSRGKVRRLQSGGFGVQVASSTATAWALSYFPVLLVVFDEATNQISWANGSLKAHAQMKSSARRSLSIRIPENNLELEQALLLEQLQAHYARLFRLDSAELTCEIYPVLMPGHKAIDSLRKIDKAVESAQGFAVERTYLDIDSAPAWTTAVNTLKGTHLSGWRFSAPGGNVENFLNHLKSTLETISQTDEEQWTAYIRGPVKLQSPEQDKRQVALGAGELTQWSCYSKISGQVVDDAGYAFQLPRGFTRCIARRARSWDGEWSVATHYDLAVQVYSSVPTTPSYRARQAAHRKHAEGQFLVWECNEDSIDVLRKILIEVGLVFREIEVASDQNGVVVGAIATPMFDPRVGLIPMALDWEEYDRGSVQMKLEDAGILSILPGREGSENIHGIVMGMFGSTFADIPSELRTADGLFPPGLPLNHADRLIWFQRFRKDPLLDIQVLTEASRSYGGKFPEQLGALSKFEFTCQEHRGMLGPIYEIGFRWSPPINQSTEAAIDSFVSIVANFFDELLPRLSRPCDVYVADTLHVLKYEAELYFEGDDPWGFARRSK